MARDASRACFFVPAPSRLSFLSSARLHGPERANDRSDRNDRLPAVRKFLTDAHVESRAKPVPGCRDSGMTRMTGMTERQRFLRWYARLASSKKQQRTGRPSDAAWCASSSAAIKGFQSRACCARPLMLVQCTCTLCSSGCSFARPAAAHPPLALMLILLAC